MELHGSAALSRRGRRRLVGLVAGGMTVTAAAVIVGCSRQTGSKWVGRARRGEGLEDRSSRPHRSPRRVSETVERAVLKARAELKEGPHVIGWATGVPASTVHAILRRHGCSRLAPRPAREEIIRYQRERPGELVHIDAKKLGRIIQPGHRVTGDRRQRARGTAGWQHLFVAIDDATRLAYAELYPDETNASAIGFLAAAQRFYQEHGITIERVLTDNGTCFKKRWSHACAERQITAKPSDSSAPCSTAGHTPRSTRPNTTEHAPYRTRSTPTITTDHTAPSPGGHHFSASTTYLGRTARSPGS